MSLAGFELARIGASDAVRIAGRRIRAATRFSQNAASDKAAK
jgi:hypothetical protein